MNGADFLLLLNGLQHDLGEIGNLTPPVTLAALNQSITDLRNDFPKDAQGNPSAQGFDGLTAEQRDRLTSRLQRLQQAMESYVDGSTDPKSIMCKKLASNAAIRIMGWAVFLVTLGLIIAICSLWRDATRSGVDCDQWRTASSESKPAGESAGPASTTTPSPQSSATTPATTPAAPATAAGQGTGTAAPRATTGVSTTAATGSTAGATNQSPAKMPEVTPSQVTLTSCEAVQLKVTGGDSNAKISWPEVPTGSLSDDGWYSAPSSIAGPQTLRIAPTVTSGTQTQTAKTATISLVPPGGPAEVYVLIMIVLMGSLGGCLHWIGSYVKAVGGRQFLRSWVAYYLLMPIEGAGLAIIVYLLLRVGILSPTSTSGQATSNLNTIGLYAFAGLTGMFSKQASEALADVFNTIFKKVQAKDEVKTDQPKAAANP